MKIFIVLMLSATFAMAADIFGNLVMPDGSAAQGAQLALVNRGYTVSLEGTKLLPSNGTILEYARKDGRFDFYDIDRSASIVAVNREGFAEISCQGLTNGSKIVLRPWGVIDGVLWDGPKVVTNAQILLESENRSSRVSLWNDLQYGTDGSGKFAFNYVPPGDWKVTHATEWFGDVIKVKAGETNHITIGGSGRPLVAKCLVPEEVAKLKQGRIIPSGFFLEYLAPESSDFYGYTVEAYLFGADYRHHNARMTPDGRIRVEDVAPGTWWLTADIMKVPKRGGKYTTFATAAKEIVIPEISGGRSDEPLDAGDLTSILAHVPLPGEDAPPLIVETADGGTFNLADRKGKYVLLDFEPTTGSWNIKTNAAIESVWKAYGGNEQFALLTLCVPPRASYVFIPGETRQPEWPVAHLEVVPRYKSRPAQVGFGLQCDAFVPSDPNLPAVFLVGPDGKIVGSHLKEDEIAAVVERFLGRK